jgi:hypothetical protein
MIMSTPKLEIIIYLNSWLNLIHSSSTQNVHFPSQIRWICRTSLTVASEVVSSDVRMEAVAATTPGIMKLMMNCDVF